MEREEDKEEEEEEEEQGVDGLLAPEASAVMGWAAGAPRGQSGSSR